MLTKATAKLISELKDKKQRQALGLFVVEGTKVVAELLASKITVKTLYATANWIATNKTTIKSSIDVCEVSEKELLKISLLQSPQQVLAVCNIPTASIHDIDFNNQFCIVLDGIQDPGNLGTIIRIADWYGINQIICSPLCADVYNSKVIQATMGSFLRVNVQYTPLFDFFNKQQSIVIGAVMNGENLHQTQLPKHGFLLIGNEGSGISTALLPFINKPVTIPKFGGAESLNAGIATAIICDAWARVSV